MTRRRKWGIAGLALAVLAIAAAGAGWWLVATQGGARFGFERLSAVFPGELQVGQMRGPLRGPLVIRGLLYRTDEVEVKIDSLALRWRLRDLVRQRIDVQSIDAFGIHVRLFAGKVQAPRDSLAPELPDLDLPMDLMVANGTLRDLEIFPVGAQAPFRVDEVRLRDAAFRDTLKIGSLVLRSPTLDLDLSGRARTRGRYASDMALVWTYRPTDRPAIRGRGRWSGDLDTLRLEQTFTGGLTGDVDVVAYEPLRRLRFRGSVRVQDLELDRVGAPWPGARLDGDLRVEGSLTALRAEGRVGPSAPSFGRWDGTVAATRDTNGIRVQHLRLAQAGRAARLDARGVVITRGPSPRLEWTASWTDLALPLDQPPTVRSARGVVRLSGTPERYRLSGDAVLAIAPVRETPVRFAGNGTTDQIAFQSIDARTLGGSLTGRGVVDWRGPVGWRMDVRGEGLDPSTFHRELQGAVAFDAATSGSLVSGGARGKVELRSLGGTLRGQPLAGSGSASFAPGAASIPLLDLQWGPNQLVASGDVGQTWNLAWSIDAPVLSAAIPYGGGSAAMEGTVVGPGGRERLQATVRADTMRWRDGRLRQLAGNAVIDFAPNGVVDADLEAQGFQSGVRQIDRAALDVSGTRGRHEITLHGVSGQDSATIAARGGLGVREWRGNLTKLDVVSRMVGAWALEREAALAAGASGATLDDLCATSGGGRLCADAVWRREAGWTLDATLDGLPLALLEPALPPAVDLTGPLTGEVHARGRGARVAGEARLELGPGTIGYPTGRGTGSTALRPSRLDVVADATDFQGRWALGIGDADSVQGELRWPQGDRGRAVAGTIRAQLRDLAFVQGLIPEVADPRGTFTADLTLAGTAAAPRWSGEAHLADGAARLPRGAVEVTEIRLDAVGDAQGQLRLDGRARSGGQIALHGDAWLAPGGVPRAEATLAGERFLAANSRTMRVIVTPDLRLFWRGDSVRVSGEVNVPEAEVVLQPAGRKVAVAPSSDVIYVVDTLTDVRAKAPLRMHSEVRLTLGRNVRVRGFGLDARITGSVLGIARPEEPVLGDGDLQVTNGSYRAYGQNLVIERGRLIFRETPITNPELDVRAARHARDGVVAGFEVSGPLAAPQFELFSEPVMAERDALSYIVLGRRVEHASELEQGLISDAATSLGLEGGTAIAGTLARELGIQEASIQSEGAFEDASLMLGTYLSPRLYVNYTVGILDPLSTLRFQYFLNNKWTLQAETGSERRGEVLYTVER